MLNNKETELMKLAIETVCRKVWNRSIFKDSISNFPQETSYVGEDDVIKIDAFHDYRDEKGVSHFYVKVVTGFVYICPSVICFSESYWLSIHGFFKSDETAGVNKLHGVVKSSDASIRQSLRISVGLHKPIIMFTDIQY